MALSVIVTKCKGCSKALPECVLHPSEHESDDCDDDSMNQTHKSLAPRWPTIQAPDQCLCKVMLLKTSLLHPV